MIDQTTPPAPPAASAPVVQTKRRWRLPALLAVIVLLAAGTFALRGSFLPGTAVSLGERFTLRIGETAKFRGQPLTLTLTGLSQPPESEFGTLGLCSGAITKYRVIWLGLAAQVECNVGCGCQGGGKWLPYEIEEVYSDYSTSAEFRVFKTADTEAVRYRDCDAIVEGRTAGGNWKDIRGECFRQMAQTYRKPAYCNQAWTADIQKYCWAEVSDLMKPQDCDTVPDSPWAKDICWAGMAYAKKDLSYCDQHQFSDQWVASYCRADVAMYSTVPVDCSIISDEGQRADCEYAQAERTAIEAVGKAQTIEDCQAIDPMDQYLCYRRLAVRDRNGNYCGLIAAGSERDRCFWMIEEQTKSTDFCLDIADKTVGDDCLLSLAMRWPTKYREDCRRASTAPARSSCFGHVDDIESRGELGGGFSSMTPEKLLNYEVTSERKAEETPAAIQVAPLTIVAPGDKPLAEASRKTLLDTRGKTVLFYTISADGKHTYYATSADGGERLVVDGAGGTVYPKIDRNVGIQISPDSRHYGCVAELKDGKRAAVIDGQAGPAYDMVSALHFGRADAHYYMAETKEGQAYVFRGKTQGAPASTVDTTGLATISPDGQRFAYLANGGEVYADGELQRNFPGFGYLSFDGLSFSADSKHLAYFTYASVGGNSYGSGKQPDKAYAVYRDNQVIDTCDLSEGYDVPADASLNYVERQYGRRKGLYVIGDGRCTIFVNVSNFVYDPAGHVFVYQSGDQAVLYRGGTALGSIGRIDYLTAGGGHATYLALAPYGATERFYAAGLDAKAYEHAHYMLEPQLSSDGKSVTGRLSINETGYPLTSLYWDDRESPAYGEIYYAGFSDGAAEGIISQGGVIYRVVFKR